MKAILNLDGFTKLIEIDDATPFINYTVHFDDQTIELPFLRMESKEVDSETVHIYKMFEPKKDIGHQ